MCLKEYVHSHVLTYCTVSFYLSAFILYYYSLLLLLLLWLHSYKKLLKRTMTIFYIVCFLEHTIFFSNAMFIIFYFYIPNIL